ELPLMPRPSRRGFFMPVEPDFPNVIRLLSTTWRRSHVVMHGNQLRRCDLTQRISLKPCECCEVELVEAAHGNPNQRRLRTDRSQDLRVDLRRHRRTAAAKPAPRY